LIRISTEADMQQRSRNIILGAVKGYSFQDLQAFIGSLAQTGYTGELCLFHQDLSAEDQTALRTVNAPFQINLQRFSGIHLSLWSRKVVYPFDERLSVI